MSVTTRVAGVVITRADKVWWSEPAITKGELAEFYDGVWPRLRPWVRDRPLVAERCPDGMRGPCFYQKNFPAGALPEAAPRVRVYAKSAGRVVHYLVGGDRATLLGMVNLGCIAVHVMNARREDLRIPDWMAFDLDPPSGDFADAARVGIALRRALDDRGVRSYPKTSGSRGLHVLVPLHPRYDQDAVRAVAAAIATEVGHRAPRLATVEHAKARRHGSVYVDVARNALGQTIAAPYSARRRPHAPVSVPLAWDEVRPSLDPSRFTIRTIGRRLARDDPWSGFWRSRQALPST